MTPAESIAELAETYCWDGDEAALQEALRRLEREPPELRALMDALERIKGDRSRKARAMAAIRARLGLPLIPGPPCRPLPPG